MAERMFAVLIGVLKGFHEKAEDIFPREGHRKGEWPKGCRGAIHTAF